MEFPPGQLSAPETISREESPGKFMDHLKFTFNLQHKIVIDQLLIHF
jgi:hypothetical protein